MPAGREMRRFYVRFPLSRLMGFVAACALDFAFLGPLVRETESNLAAGIIPVGLSLVVLGLVAIWLFVGPPPVCHWAMKLLLSLPVVLMLALFLLAGILAGIIKRDPVLICVIGIPILLVLRVLIWSLVPPRCPSCGRRGLLRDPGSDSARLRDPRETHWCWSCGARFRRWSQGPWEAVPVKDSPR